jgi:hypothetical protein
LSIFSINNNKSKYQSQTPISNLITPIKEYISLNQYLMHLLSVWTNWNSKHGMVYPEVTLSQSCRIPKSQLEDPPQILSNKPREHHPITEQKTQRLPINGGNLHWETNTWTRCTVKESLQIDMWWCHENPARSRPVSEWDHPKNNEKVCIHWLRILYIWHIRHPLSGYVQGINDTVTPFIVVYLGDHIKLNYELL